MKPFSWKPSNANWAARRSAVEDLIVEHDLDPKCPGCRRAADAIRGLHVVKQRIIEERNALRKEIAAARQVRLERFTQQALAAEESMRKREHISAEDLDARVTSK